MTAIQYVENILLSRWNKTDLGGQRNALPAISAYDGSGGVRVFRESSQHLRLMSPDEYDVLLLRDGGVTEIDPQSFAWAEERLVSRVTIDARTTGQAGSVRGRERLWGKRTASNDAPRYGGLTGEIKRVMDEVRKGDKEFDLIRVREQNDLSGEMGGQIWRATTEVVLDVRANQIDPTP